MSPLIHGPGPEAVSLARELIREPSAVPVSEDMDLSAAVAAVAAELDEYDLRLISQVRDEPASPRKREVLEQAMAQRIEQRRLLLDL
jgi:hypothetical protein